MGFFLISPKKPISEPDKGTLVRFDCVFNIPSASERATPTSGEMLVEIDTDCDRPCADMMDSMLFTGGRRSPGLAFFCTPALPKSKNTL